MYMRILSGRQLLLASTWLVVATPLFCLASDEGFYRQSERGWFWHEVQEQPKNEEKKPEEKLPPPAAAPTQKPADDQKVEINAEWLKDNLPKLRMAAINNPTPDNLGAFYSAQRLMLDMSSRFAKSSENFFAKDATWLSEDHRRPTEGFALSQYKKSINEAQQPLLKKIGKEAGLWFFFSSTCPYCKQQLPVILNLSRIYGVSVLYVSLDGGTFPGIPADHLVIDSTGQVSKDFNIEYTPTTYLVGNNAKTFEVVSAGMSSVSKMVDRMVDVAKDKKWISQEEFQSVQQVRQENTLDNGNLMLSQADLNDPHKLMEILHDKINLSESTIGTPVTPRTLGVTK